MQFMTKLSRKPLPREDWEEFFDQICIALTMCETKQEVREFLNDLWTYTEKKMFSKARYLIVSELKEVQELPEEDIEKKLDRALSRCINKKK